MNVGSYLVAISEAYVGPEWFEDAITKGRGYYRPTHVKEGEITERQLQEHLGYLEVRDGKMGINKFLMFLGQNALDCYRTCEGRTRAVKAFEEATKRLAERDEPIEMLTDISFENTIVPEPVSPHKKK